MTEHVIATNKSETIARMSQDTMAYALNFLPASGNKKKLGIVNCGYGDTVLPAAASFEEVEILEKRIPFLQEVENILIKHEINNVILKNIAFTDYKKERYFDCLFFNEGLEDVHNEHEALRVLLQANEALKEKGMLLIKTQPDLTSLLTAQAERIGFRFIEQRKYGGDRVLQLEKISYDAEESINTTLRVACFASMPFHFRSLKPLAALYEQSLVTLSTDEVMAWKPDVIVVADGWSVEFWRDYCDAFNVTLIGMRHGSVTRYGYAESQYNYADYMCGSPWDIEDTLLSNVQPRKGFLITGNSWVDQVFQLPEKQPNTETPVILFAPTYNPEISAAVWFGERVVKLIRSVYPDSRIIIKPHPAIVQHEHSFVVDKAIFRDLMRTWREQSAADPLVELIDAPDASIADYFALADILVADASSLIYEFMTLDRPIILYSSEKKVAHWEFNPKAPGNAWRDIGLEFSDDKTFLHILRSPFTLHDKQCRKAQKERTQFLHGRYQDGKSIHRVAKAINTLSPLSIMIYGDRASLTQKKNIAAELSNKLAFIRHQIIDKNATDDDLMSVACFEAAIKQSHAMTGPHHTVLLVNADERLLPGSAHQISHAAKKFAWGTLDVLALDTSQEKPLACLPFSRLSAWLNRDTDDAGLSLREEAWRHNRINVIPGKNVTRNPGKNVFWLGSDAAFTLVPAIAGLQPQDAQLQMTISPFERKEYNQFPFNTAITVNGNIVQEMVTDTIYQRVINIPWLPDEEGRSEIGIVSNGHTALFNDVANNVCFVVRSAQLSLEEEAERPSLLVEWLERRQLSAIQQRQVAEYERAENHYTIIDLFIIYADVDENLDATLRSLRQHNSVSDRLQFRPVIFTLREDLNPGDNEITSIYVSQRELVSHINQQAFNSNGDWLMLIRAGNTFTSGGAVVARLQLPLARSCAAVYADAVLEHKNEISSLALQPDFNLDLLLSMPALMADNWLFNKAVFTELNGFNERYIKQFQFDFITRLIEQKGIGVIGHLDEPLLVREPYTLRHDDEHVSILEKHLHNRGYTQGKVLSTTPGVYSLRYHTDAKPLVSIIIPTKDQLPVLITCITTLLEKTQYSHYELLVVDNNSEQEETRQWLQGLAEIDPQRIRVLSYPWPFNYSAMNNMAVAQARGEYIVLLNNDTAIIQGDWLDNMLNHAQRPEVGITGAKLLYPNGQVQHAGVLLGLRGPAEHPFIGRGGDEQGYLHRLVADQNYTAVTAACLMVRKEVYQAVGGLDEDNFRVSYNDIDFCLKVREAGYLTVWTPYAKVMHEGSVSQRKVDRAAYEKKRQRFVAEQDAMYQKWLPIISKDPAYNANLSLTGEGFELIADSELTWRPVFWKPAPTVLAHMADLTGCGEYRIIQPFNAMRDAGLIQGKLSKVLLNLPQFAQYEADSIILQRQVAPEFHDWIMRVSKLRNAFKVFELDDYLPNLPLKSVHRKDMPKDILKSLRKSLSLVDRFVVSTHALADAFHGMNNDIRVVENRLSPILWRGLTGQRRQGRKPRVGWAGGSSHTGDLEMIADVVKALSHRVEWVFFGMCPAALRPYVHEYHPGVAIKDYPAKLASLNLDLALAPVEDNQFNRCKSNLRLLEYGACGFPVICSDVECYHYDFPVTRVKNRFKEWMEAIEMHLDDAETSYKMGDALQEKVRTEWMLEGEHIQRWASLWLP